MTISEEASVDYPLPAIGVRGNARGEFDYRFDGPRLYFGWNFR